MLVSSFFIPSTGALIGTWRYRSMLWQRDGAVVYGEPRDTIEQAAADADAVIAASKSDRRSA